MSSPLLKHCMELYAPLPSKIPSSHCHVSYPTVTSHAVINSGYDISSLESDHWHMQPINATSKAFEVDRVCSSGSLVLYSPGFKIVRLKLLKWSSFYAGLYHICRLKKYTPSQSLGSEKYNLVGDTYPYKRMSKSPPRGLSRCLTAKSRYQMITNISKVS